MGNEIVKTICAKGGEALFLATNVLDRNILEQNLADILKAYGRVDALLNAAGGNMPGATIAPASDIFDLKIDEFQKVVDLNLTDVSIADTSISKTDDRAEKRSYCQFLLNGSFPAFDTCGRLFGFQSRHFQLYRIYGHRNCQKFGEGIRINAIAPGFFLTEQNRTLLTNPDGTYTQRGQDVIRQTPFGRMGRAEELCGTIQYLISDAASFVTGTVAIVDGGFNAFAM